MIKRAFTEHPASVGESYLEHMGMAFSFSAKMLGAGVCCFIHGLFPFLFVKTGSSCIDQLHRAMVTNRDQRNGATAAGDLPSMSQDAINLRAAE